MDIAHILAVAGLLIGGIALIAYFRERSKNNDLRVRLEAAQEQNVHEFWVAVLYDHIARAFAAVLPEEIQDRVLRSFRGEAEANGTNGALADIWRDIMVNRPTRHP